MTGFSKILSSFSRFAGRSSVLFSKTTGNNLVSTQLRESHGRAMFVRPGKFYTKKYFDMLHYNICLAGLPFALLFIYHTMFVGPAKLTEIPEGYEPRHWEYHKHPIKRFLAKNFYTSPEESYETNLHEVYVEQCSQKMRALEKKVRKMMSENQDYKGWYYVPVPKESFEIKQQYLEDQGRVGYNSKFTK